MATRTVTGSDSNDSVIISNAIDTSTGGPSTLRSAVTVQTSSDGNPVTVNPTGSTDSSNYFNVNLNGGNDTLIADNMSWARSSTNSFDNISMGSGDDLASLDRSAVRNNLDMGTGNDTLVMTDSYAGKVNMGDGDDKLVAGPGGAQLTDAEISAKAGAPMMTMDGGAGSNTLNLIGDWTLTLSSGYFTLDTDGTVDGEGGTLSVNTISSDQMSQVWGMPAVLAGTVRWADLVGSGQTVTNGAAFQNFEALNAVCFTAGTMVDTPNGPVAIETLSKGDLVETVHGLKPVVWIGKRRLDVIDLAANTKLLPVRIPVGALGNGLPTADISFSPQHRVAVRSAIAQRMFGADTVLASAKHLVGCNGIDVDGDVREVTYVHIMFDQHTCLRVCGIEAETMYPGAEAFKALSKNALDELRLVFDDIDAILSGDVVYDGCMPFLKGRDARSLVARHVKNAQPLYR